MGTILSGPAIWFSNVEFDGHLGGRRGQERHLSSRLLPCHRHLPMSKRSRGGDPLLLDPSFCYLHFFWVRKFQAGSPSPGFGHPVVWDLDYVILCKHATSCYWFRLPLYALSHISWESSLQPARFLASNSTSPAILEAAHPGHFGTV